MINADQLVDIMPGSNGRVITYEPLLNAAMTEFGITSPRREAAFIAQIAVESGQLLYTREIASGAAYDIGEKAKALGNTPEDDGDGERYRGRALLQITGRSNYRLCGVALGRDLLQFPELLEQPELACRASGWFWKYRGLNAYADTDKFGSLTRAINGGYTHIDERISFWLRARLILGVKPL